MQDTRVEKRLVDIIKELASFACSGCELLSKCDRDRCPVTRLKKEAIDLLNEKRV